MIIAAQFLEFSIVVVLNLVDPFENPWIFLRNSSANPLLFVNITV